ncbi:hypothetical protein EC957_003147 [Mortierella hygrophila]|uniref:Uncharacterized protein n=1 Tax=Mortierella hygrophila TaxID=979708 RepID=A0A9P6FEQ8_9FUNG|nr:hypothetical protein EC957_003147 [Mortierella hygrophila]
MNVLRVWRPDLYKGDLCRVCGLEMEDNENILACSKSRATQEELWEDALDRRQKQLKPGKQPLSETVWRIPRTSKLLKALWQAIKRPGEEEEEELEQHTLNAWAVSHIYRGLVPKALVTQWSKVFKDVAESRYEEENIITNSMKRTRTTKDQRAQWTQTHRWKQIYGRKLREDECLCGRAVTKHKEQRCSGEQNNTRVVDGAVINTLLGLRRMDIMERIGNMVIKELEEEHI